VRGSAEPDDRPCDDADLVVKMLNSGAPGGHARFGRLYRQYLGAQLARDKKYSGSARRPPYLLRSQAQQDGGHQPQCHGYFHAARGLHLHQAGVLPGELLPASLFDVAMVAYQVDFSTLNHPLCIYIPKSESADEALWWRDLSR